MYNCCWNRSLLLISSLVDILYFIIKARCRFNCNTRTRSRRCVVFRNFYTGVVYLRQDQSEISETRASFSTNCINNQVQNWMCRIPLNAVDVVFLHFTLVITLVFSFRFSFGTFVVHWTFLCTWSEFNEALVLMIPKRSLPRSDHFIRYVSLVKILR